jgi:hypothetical protein
MPRSLIPVITPHGSLRLDQADDDFVPESGLADRLEKSFERGSAHGLLHLGTSEAGSVLPASLAWWRDFGMRFIADLCALGDAKGPAGRNLEMRGQAGANPAVRGCQRHADAL